MNKVLATALLAAIPIVNALAADIRVLSAGAVEPGLHAFARLAKQELGHELIIQFNTAPQIAKRLEAGDAYDLLISPPAVIDQAMKNGKLIADGRVTIGRVGAGIIVRAGTPAPDIASVDSLKEAVLAADSLVYNSASTGLYLDRLFTRLGILETLKPKTTRYPDGASVMEHVIKGKGREIGFGAITEIHLYTAKGLQFVGPLPADVQNYTRYDAALMSGAASNAAAKEILRLLATSEAKAGFNAAGIE